MNNATNNANPETHYITISKGDQFRGLLMVEGSDRVRIEDETGAISHLTREQALDALTKFRGAGWRVR